MIQKQTNIHPIFQYIEDKGNLLENIRNTDNEVFSLYLLYQS